MSSVVVREDGSHVAPAHHCHGCALQTLGTGFMEASGFPHSGLLFVGEALGEHEAHAGLPFVGEAGFFLGRLLRWMQLRREHVRIANVVWCRPPGNKLAEMPYAADAIAHCTPYLKSEIHRWSGAFPTLSHHPTVMRELHDGRSEVQHEAVTWSPQQLVVVALGNIAFHRLTGWGGITERRGYVYWSDEFACWVVPTFHPSYLMRGNAHQSLWFRWDVEKALALTKRIGHLPLMPMPLVDPPPAILHDFIGRYAQALAANPRLRLAFDIETLGTKLDSPITRISFAFGPHEKDVISLAWASHYRWAIDLLLGGFGDKTVWNAPFDVPRLLNASVPMRGRIHDAMNAWHVWQSDLDKSLEMVATRYLPWIKPWKHLSKTNPGYYSAIDSWVLWQVDRGIQADLLQDNMLDVYERHIVSVGDITQRMSQAGVLVDRDRQAVLSIDLGLALANVEAQMQVVAPAEIRALNPKFGFVKTPKDTTGLVQRPFTVTDKFCPCGQFRPTKPHLKGCGGVEAVVETRTILRWVEQERFVPSTPALIRYAKYRNHKVYTNYITNATTMDDEAIAKLRKRYPKDPLYPLVLDHRDIQKEKSTYVDGIPLDLQGLIHALFTDKPSTLRFACESPNMQNWPRPLPGRPGPRALIIARPGHILFKRDYSAIEAVLVGVDAGDGVYTRMAKLGIHDFVHAFVESDILKRTDIRPTAAWSDADLRALFAEQKARWKDVRDACKQVVHLSNYLGSAERAFMLQPQVFGSLDNAKRLQAFYFELFPSIRTWQWNLCLQAERDGYVRNAFGYRHFFFLPFTYEKGPDNTWQRTFGVDAKRIAAFRPQSNASGIIREAMLACDDSPAAEFLRLTIHDELFCECPVERFLEADAWVRAAMEQPLTAFPLPLDWGLGPFLTIGTEGAAGYRWSEMHADFVP